MRKYARFANFVIARSLLVMVGYELGYPVVRSTGMAHKVIERFTEITGADIKLE